MIFSLADTTNLDLTRFDLKQDYFVHNSQLHGINHVYRVMIHCLMLGKLMECPREQELAFCAAFIHDMERMHDGYCTEHGRWASERKLPVFEPFFIRNGITKDEMDLIRIAVMSHSQLQELQISHKAYIVTAILKDADALDRIRLGKDNLNTDYLRISGSTKLIDFAKALFFVSSQHAYGSLNEILQIADELIHSKFPYLI